jgi:hypothetical protein
MLKFYNPSEHLATDEIIVLFKERVIFKQYILKKHKCSGIQIYKLCNMTGYTYDMSINFWKGWAKYNTDNSYTCDSEKYL